jgi:hypothetical protein
MTSLTNPFAQSNIVDLTLTHSKSPEKDTPITKKQKKKEAQNQITCYNPTFTLTKMLKCSPTPSHYIFSNLITRNPPPSEPIQSIQFNTKFSQTMISWRKSQRRITSKNIKESVRVYSECLEQRVVNLQCH